MKKYILFVIDGAADHSYQVLGDQTPIEAAASPALNRLSERGRTGLVQCIPSGEMAGTETAFLTLFGGNCKGVGRGEIEALGFGLQKNEYESVLRANLCNVEGYMLKSHCSGELSSAEGAELIQALQQDPQTQAYMDSQGIRLVACEGFRHLCFVRSEVPRTMPPHQILGEPYYMHLPESWANWLVRCAQVLADHPVNARRRDKGSMEANFLWPWGEGSAPSLPNFTKTYKISGACAAGAPIVKGIASLAGLKAPDIPGATGDVDTNWIAKVRMGRKLLETHDFLLLHLEAPDEYSHRGQLHKKVEAIRIAGCMIDQLCSSLDGQSYRIAILPDHYTYSDTGKHGEKPTPYLIFDSCNQTKSEYNFSERQCTNSVVIPGNYFLNELIWGKTHKSGGRA